MFGILPHVIRAIALLTAMVGMITRDSLLVSFSIFLMMAATGVDGLKKSPVR